MQDKGPQAARRTPPSLGTGKGHHMCAGRAGQGHRDDHMRSQILAGSQQEHKGDPWACPFLCSHLAATCTPKGPCAWMFWPPCPGSAHAQPQTGTVPVCCCLPAPPTRAPKDKQVPAACAPRPGAENTARPPRVHLGIMSQETTTT